MVIFMMENCGEKKKKMRIIILILLVLVFLITAVVIIGRYIPKKNDESDKYKNNTVSSVSNNLPENPINFDALQKDNGDVIGWIKVDGTIIDYPVLMSGMETEEDFYLDHDMYRKKLREGSIYVQRYNSNDFGDFNTIIYGHNMRTGRMFGQLKKFKNKEFFNKNRNIYIYTPEHILKYEIISAFIHDDRHLFNSYAYFTEEGRADFIKTCQNPNTFTKNIIEGLSVADDDKLITLSTCTSVDNERYLVVGRLISDTATN
ncbi:MAG: class B sortase [Clostridia bacterium]|nr:class B sortase [Clostridia bacterium]